MNIPENAVEAARGAFEADGWSTRGMLEEIIPAAIRAAAPFIAAQALRDAAEGVGTWVKPQHIALSTPDAHVARGYLRARADELDPQ